MTNTPATQATWHDTLAKVWARYHGQKGTPRQLTAIKRQLNVTDLERMLTERGYVIASPLPQLGTKEHNQ